MQSDAEFLAKHGFIDYSLVMWHETLNPDIEYNIPNGFERRNRFLNDNGKSVVHIAIIDYL